MQGKGKPRTFARQREALLPPFADQQQLQLATEILKAADTVHDDSFLIFTGDKRLFFSKSGRSFLMFGVKGRAWIAIGPPIGLIDEAPELESHFIETARRGRGWPSFYAVGQNTADRLKARGFVSEKVGERAVIDLDSFSLTGKAKQDLRSARNRAVKHGCHFQVCDSSPDLLETLKPVSDKWLEMRGGTEKQFSLGRFDPNYLKNFKLAIVYHQNRPIAFANIWTHQDLVTLDLMRFEPSEIGVGMDYLITELSLWGQSKGFREFDLGLAPLSGLNSQQNPSTVARLGSYIFARAGRFYGFEGLRAYKEKFSPIWEPSYICAASQWRAAGSAVAVASLTGGGLRQILRAGR